ncbi:MAG: hypothetical protein HQL77_12530 [Magnetococcales bacterium]|nr:hypothetical protein [Magnetococcales bacterium]MBF0419522.1 hypothetical protein [Magnetococcales bacterium]MBF0436184.1 hypothetical protein [Magnetococcales bacterium]
MKMKTALAAFVGVFMAGGLAFAGQADDIQWIAKCMKDNAREGASPDVVSKYCTCMTAKMPESETLSVSAWEKTHPTEMAACEKEAGWK